MHENEIKIDLSLVRKLLSQQFPKLENLNLVYVKHSGTDHAIFRLGDDKCIRLPRIDSAAEQVKKEQEWLPKIARNLSLEIPAPQGSGMPTEYYPYNWSIYSWIQGKNSYDEQFIDLKQTAKDLAHFINSLHLVNTDNAPIARRGLSLETQDEAFQSSVKELSSYMNVEAIPTIWEECLNLPKWNKPNVWFHGDLLPSNLIVKDGKLKAVIDWGLSGVGDPACDLIPAWSTFDTNSRKIFRDNLKVDDFTWLRAKGWALSIAVIIIPYYKNTNPVLVSVANRILKEILQEYK